ncbi:PREDICTED: receptor kinase-like protein Xa21 [Nicotiana attenuata]|uniref:receptor kinase-like protein Xa21 n=1 Tax=Nicotiana attenuata TaxID=49451 RepID=UPI000904C230|nr:PREDICTED: receptor kinase-like protein Xa21 [Nicotiana attenuata]
MSLASNNLSGSLPSASTYWQTNLHCLHLGNNSIDGVIPSSISNSSNLRELHLYDNKFSGPIPNNSLGDLRQLERLRFHQQSPTSLERFSLYYSEIRGQIPLGIGNLSNLNTLSLFGNDLTGSVPRTVCYLQNLQVLALDQNRLTGPFPECLCKLPELGSVSLSYNQISGPIPYCIGNTTSLRNIYLNSNRLTNIPMSLWSLKDLLVLDLSNNSLVGSLPPDFGNLDAITLVDLSRNRLSRSIPTTVGDLQKLIYLSLAFNELQGFIPEPLGKMISLESANLCNNILSGMIPKSLETLRYLKDFNSFMGNDELCGGFLFRPCKARSVHHSWRSRFLLIVLVPLVVPLMGLGSIVVFMFMFRRRRNNVPTQVESLPATTILARISYIEIERATQGFDQCNLLGRGGFGSVYKGIFANEMVLAIKVFNLQIEGAFKSFDTECEVLRNLRHRNLTKVISSCSNMDFKALLVEYMPNGSLEQWLHSDDYYLNMIQRLDIMIDVTSALEYLRSIMVVQQSLYIAT